MNHYLIPSLFSELEDICNFHSGCRPEKTVNQSALGISIAEDDKKYFIDIPLPGVKGEEVDLMVDAEKRKLFVKANAKMERENVKIHMQGKSSYSYEIPVPASVDLQTGIEAACKEGILSISLNKKHASQPVKVNVKVE